MYRASKSKSPLVHYAYMQANTSDILTTTYLISPLDASLDGGGGGGVVDPESAWCIPSDRGKSGVSGDGGGGVGLGGGTT